MPANRSHAPRSRRLRYALAAATMLACLAFAPSALAASINPVNGSPFPTGGYNTHGLAFSPNGQLLATANSDEGGVDWLSDLSVFSVSAPGVLTAVMGSPFQSGTDPFGSGNNPIAIAFSPNGQLLATSEDFDPTATVGVGCEGEGDCVYTSGVSVYSVGAGAALSSVAGSPFLLPATGGVLPYSIAFSPNGGLLAVAGTGQSDIDVFTVAAGGTLTAAATVDLEANVFDDSLAFSPNGQFLAVAGRTAANEGVSVFSVASGGALTLVSGSPFGIAYNSGFTLGVSSLAFSPSGGVLAAEGGQGLVTFTVASNGTLTETAGSPYADSISGRLAFSPDGGLLAVTNGVTNTVSLFSAASGGTLTQLSDSPYATGNDPASVAFSPNGGVLAVSNALDDTVSVFSVGSVPVIATPTVTGTLGSNGWYTSNVSLGWSISDPLAPLSYTTSGCVNQMITTDEQATVYSCSATNAAGTADPVSVTLKRDATPPTITFTGNSGAYTVAQAVTITCSATDSISGVATSTCPANSLAGVPAYTLALGKHTLSASATNNAGLTNTATASFTVSVTPAGLCNLTTQFVEGSTNYQKLTAKQKATVNALATGGCTDLGAISAKLPAPLQTALISLYKLLINALVPQGWLTQTQATTLTTLAATL
jgi:WD40 repeat protein